MKPCRYTFMAMFTKQHNYIYSLSIWQMILSKQHIAIQNIVSINAFL